MAELALTKIISGGQTGADQGALEAALILGLKTGGCMPRGWRTDDGPRPMFERTYGMLESMSEGYAARTLANVTCSDATLVFGRETSPGCKLTLRYCREAAKPYYIFPWDQISWNKYHAIRLCFPYTAQGFREWLIQEQVKVLNVAGNRERTNRGIFQATKEFLIAALKPR